MDIDDKTDDKTDNNVFKNVFNYLIEVMADEFLPADEKVTIAKMILSRREVALFYTDATTSPLWVISCDDIWLNSFADKSAAVGFCKDLGLAYTDTEPK